MDRTPSVHDPRYALAVGADVHHGVEVCNDDLSGEWSQTAHIPRTAEMDDTDPGAWSVRFT